MRYTPKNIIQSWKLWYHAGKVDYRYPELGPSYPPEHYVGKIALWLGYNLCKLKLAKMNSLHGGS